MERRIKMKIKKNYLDGLITVFLVLTLALSILVCPVYSAIPQKMNYQGYLTNAAGVPVSGTVQMVFSIYNVSVGGSTLWTETHSVTMNQGVYSVILGESSTPNPINLPFDTAYYLGVQVGADPEMTPRKVLTSVGYAFRASTVESIGSHTHSGADITSGTVSEPRIDPLIAGDSEVNSLIKTHADNASAHHTRYTNAEAVAAIKAADGSGSGLDADLLDGQNSTYYLSLVNQTGVLPISKGGTESSTKNFVDLSSSQTVGGNKAFSSQISSTVATGTAPLQVASTTLVSNLNAEMVEGKKLADLDTRYGQASPVQNPRSNTLTTIDSGGYVGYYTSITLGTDGLAVISYYDNTNYDLKVAHCGNAACSSGNTITTIDSGGNVGQHTSITIGMDGLPLISYYDVTNYNLKVAHCGNTACSSGNTITTVDSSGDVGNYTSITIGKDGLPIISYFDDTNDDLKVAHCGNADCSSGNIVTTVDSEGIVGSYTSITIGTDGQAVISYYDETNYHLKVIQCFGAYCSSFANNITTVDSGGTVGQYTSITIGTDGLPVISYLDVGNNDLKVAKCGNADCSSGNTITTIDSGGTVGQYTSITIGTDGLPVISYFDWTNGDLKVAKCGNAACSSGNTLTTIDSGGNVGGHTSITIGTDGLPVISYYDVTNYDLKVAKCANPFCLNNWSRR
jgi:hypothetical protein